MDTNTVSSNVNTNTVVTEVKAVQTIKTKAVNWANSAQGGSLGISAVDVLLFGGPQ